jgi:hypothetical protein
MIWPVAAVRTVAAVFEETGITVDVESGEEGSHVPWQRDESSNVRGGSWFAHPIAAKWGLDRRRVGVSCVSAGGNSREVSLIRALS